MVARCVKPQNKCSCICCARCGGAAMSAAELAPPEGAGSAPLGSVPSALVPPSASRPVASTQISATLTAAPLLPTQPHPSSRLSSDPSIQAVVERRHIQVILSFFFSFSVDVNLPMRVLQWMPSQLGVLTCLLECVGVLVNHYYLEHTCCIETIHFAYIAHCHTCCTGWYVINSANYYYYK
jgi:hypothetical protein